MNKRLALTVDGNITYCVASEENIGKGRCNHVLHQLENENIDRFLRRASLYSENLESKNYIRSLKELKGIDGLELIPSAEVQDGIITLTSKKKFGSTKMIGNQFKGDLIIEEGEDISKKFVKLDALNPSIRGKWKHGLDNSNSSITEDICSKFIENISNISIKSVKYNFEVFKMSDEIETGTVSDNFMEEGYFQEMRIAPNSELENNPNFKVSFDEYYNKIAIKSDKEELLNNMIEFFGRYKVPKDKAKNFIIQQAALDLILDNQDRKENPSNIIFLVPVRDDQEIIPLNMDYGRCLQVLWTRTSESRASELPDIDNIIDEIAEERLGHFSGGGLFGGRDLKESVDFLLDNGFEPFDFNKEQFFKSFDYLEEKVCKNNLKFRYYIQVKKKIIEKNIKTSRNKKIIERR